MEVPERQLTLVSFYGEKPETFAVWIHELQKELSVELGNNFEPYSLQQIHGTIIGLEGTRMEGGVRSNNRLEHLGELRTFDFDGMLGFLRTRFGGCSIQVGGFRPNGDYSFRSQGQHPYVRSFSLQRGTAVAMGWPKAGATFPNALDELRRALEPFGALRKWAWNEGAVDNDFYFVVGRVSPTLDETMRRTTELKVRELIASSPPFMLNLSPRDLQFISYTDRRLTPEQTRVFPLKDTATTAEALMNAYGFCKR
jgi:hypothetical protein